MGQRLNLEILKGETVLANAYYHWSGYTSSSSSLASIVVNKIIEDEKNGITYSSDVHQAVELLRATGGMLDIKELEAYQKLTPSYQEDRACNRNEGLISVTPEGIEETREWEEARVSVYLDEGSISFDAFAEYESKEDFMDSYGIDEHEYQDENIVEILFDPDVIPFKDVPAFNELIQGSADGYTTSHGTIYFKIQ